MKKGLKSSQNQILKRIATEELSCKKKTKYWRSENHEKAQWKNLYRTYRQAKEKFGETQALAFIRFWSITDAIILIKVIK